MIHQIFLANLLNYGLSEDTDMNIAMASTTQLMAVFVKMGIMTAILNMGITTVNMDILVILFDRVERKESQPMENPSGLCISSEAKKK